MTLEEKIEFTRGSEWRKWDLHVHTPFSHNFKGDWKQFIQQIQKADCEVVGINDYFSVDGYKKLKKEIKDDNLDIREKRIIPVVELRMIEQLYSKNSMHGTSFNFHIIFNDEIIGINNIENFIKSLSVNNTTIGEDYNDKEKLKDKKVSFKDTLEKLRKDERFKDNYLIWLPYNEHGGIDKINSKSDGDVKKGFIGSAHILGTSNKKQIEYFLNNKDGLGKKPCIKGSDSHSWEYPIGKLQDENSNPIEKFTWIKAHPTFEGLKQIVYEPEGRVFIGEENPSFNYQKSYFNQITIEKEIKIFNNDDKLKFAKNTIPLNKNLITIIGGRGAGKSLLINYIKSRFKEDKKIEDSKDKKYSKDENFILEYQKENKKEGDKQEYKGDENVLDFVFIEQSKIKTITDKDGLKDEIKKLLGLELKFDEDLNAKTIKNSNNIKEVLNWFKQKDENGNFLNQKKDNEEKKALNKKLLDTIKTEGNKEKLEKYTGNIKELAKINDNLKMIDNFKNELSQYEHNLNLKIKNINEIFDSKDLKLWKVDFSNISNKIEDQIKDLKKKEREKINSNHDIKESFEGEGYKGDLNSLLNNADTYQKKIEQADHKLREITNKEQELTELKKERKQIASKIKKEYKRQKKALEDKWENISQNKTEEQSKTIEKIILKDDIHLEVKIKFDKDKFYKLILEKLDNRTYKEFDDLGIEVNDIDSWEKFITDGKFDNKEQEEDFKTIIEKIFFDLETRSRYIKVIPQLTYKKKTLDKLSAGQKGTLYLRLQLATQSFSTPIIFDQPEDDLDNEFIVNELVPLIKDLKKYRQMILVTHNANIVVNSDAEQIIVAKNEEEVLTYESGPIEDKAIKKHICQILEGGESAFKNRKQKYNF